MEPWKIKEKERQASKVPEIIWLESQPHLRVGALLRMQEAEVSGPGFLVFFFLMKGLISVVIISLQA